MLNTSDETGVTLAARYWKVIFSSAKDAPQVAESWTDDPLNHECVVIVSQRPVPIAELWETPKGLVVAPPQPRQEMY
jgi:hypothetical protein